MAIRVVYMGSAALSCPPLRRLVEDAAFEVVGVVTPPDRPGGRHLQPRPSPVRVLAETLGVPVCLTPEKVNAPETLVALEGLRPQVIAVVAYGQFLGRRLLALPPHGCVNVHPSLLPKYRGAAPIPWAIARGEAISGVTTILMNAGMDEGDVLMQRPVAIGPDETGGDLHARMAEEGAALLAETLVSWVGGALTPQPQDPTRASYAPKLKKEDGFMDWGQPAVVLANRVRAFNPWPGCYFHRHWVVADPAALDVVRVLACAVEPGEGVPGLVLAADGRGLLVATGGGALRLLTLQPAGRRAMSGAAYLAGHSLSPGERLPV